MCDVWGSGTSIINFYSVKRKASLPLDGIEGYIELYPDPLLQGDGIYE